MILSLCRRMLVLLLITIASIGGNKMATPEVEKKLFADLSAAYGKSATTVNKGVSKAYKDASDAIVLPPPVVVPPIVTPPVSTAWPKDLTANPTGPKKPLIDNQGDLNTTSENQIIDARNVTGKILVHNNGVKITNFKAMAVWKDQGKTGLVLEDGIIDGQNITENAVQWSDYTARRVEVTRTVDAFKAHGNTTIEDCWIHDLFFSTNGPGGFSHNDGVQTSSGNNVFVRRTRIERTRGNAALYAQADQGTVSNVVWEDNYMTDSGNYMCYSKESVTAPQYGLVNGLTIKNNTFGKRPDYLDPTWGAMMAECRANNLVWENNIQQSSGKQTKLDAAGKAYPV